MIRILIVDDHPIVREGLAAVLEAQEDMEVVAEAGDGADGVTKFQEANPDIVLMDLAMPGTDGVEAIRRIRALDVDAKVVVLTAYDTDDRIFQAVQAGARGYLLKGAPRDEIFRAIREVKNGGSLLEPAIAGKLLSRVGDILRGGAVEKLTARELDILTLMARGMRNKEIANQLYITERTVKFHANAIYRKLNVSSRTEAVSKALRHGLVEA
ncbi:MAG: DNA-binding response regulator [Sphaerobacteraceae bacterium]|nr:MAG: DNA-binding response regulator [Sphaerobacteraceae bacterium]